LQTVKKIALIVGGGTGSRMGSDVPKQFLSLAGKPVLFHTLEKFRDIADHIVLVLPDAQFHYWKRLCTDHHFDLPHILVAGGATRSQSVFNGLQSLNADGVVAIHDAVRPLVSEQLITTLFNDAITHGSAVPVIPVRESLRKKSGKAVNREDYLIVQTPQCFRIDDIMAAYIHAGNSSFSDDASVFECNGGAIHTVEGESGNFKITFREDLAAAEAMITSIK
jgi:2-C-methyl-D-erythritol 4-phosphate cytidylyltransferase